MKLGSSSQLDKIAATLASKSRELFIKIPREEYIESLGDFDKQENTPNVFAISTFSQNLTTFVIMDVLYQNPQERTLNSLKKRTIVLDNWIHIAYLAIQKYKNYDVGYSIYKALLSQSVSRLAKTHHGLSREAEFMLADLKNLFSVTGRHENYRTAFQQAKGMIIPVMDIARTEIVKFYEGIKGRKIVTEESIKNNIAKEARPFYFKYIDGHKVMQDIDMVRSRLSTDYEPLPRDDRLLAKFDSYLSYKINEDELYKDSLKCEARGSGTTVRTPDIRHSRRKISRFFKKELETEKKLPLHAANAQFMSTIEDDVIEFINTIKSSSFSLPHEEFHKALNNITGSIKNHFDREKGISLLSTMHAELYETLYLLVENYKKTQTTEALQEVKRLYNMLGTDFDVELFHFDELDISIGGREIKEFNELLTACKNIVTISHSKPISSAKEPSTEDKDKSSTSASASQKTKPSFFAKRKKAGHEDKPSTSTSSTPTKGSSSSRE